MDSIYDLRWVVPVAPDFLEEYPDLCVNVLASCITKGITTRILLENPPWVRRRSELQGNWIESVRRMTRKKAKRLLEETDDPVEKELIEHAAGKKGHPIELRKPAIKAVVLCQYRHKKLIDVIEQVCPCGLEHTPDMVRTQCYPRLKPVVGRLKRLLAECDINLPEVPEVEICFAQPLPIEAFLGNWINKADQQERRTKLLDAITKVNATRSAQGAAFRRLKASGKKLEVARKVLEDAETEAVKPTEEHTQALEEYFKILDEGR